MIHHTKRRNFDVLFLYGFAVLSVLVLSNISPLLYRLQHKVLTQTLFTSSPLFTSEAFADVSVRAKTYVVYDIVNARIIAEKNGDLPVPIASITKVMTAITARLHHTGKEIITITPRSIDGAYDLGLRKGQAWKLDELLKYMLVFSSNDAALTIADSLGGRKVFVEQMNEDARELGLLLTFTHPAGLDEDGKYGGYGSAHEVAKLLAIARKYFPELYDATTKTRTTVTASTGKLTGVPNTNQDIEDFLGAELSKTGYTDEAGGNLAITVDVALGHPVAIVVLGSTREERFKDVKILYNTLLKSLE